MDFPRKNRPVKEANVLPTINLVFLLLIFFMVTGVIEKIDIVPVDLPLAENGKVLDEGHVVILMGLHDEVLVNDEFVDLAQVPGLLKQALKDNPEKIISIKGDSMLPAEKVVSMMEIVRMSGGKNVSLVTQSML
jgi:biopolymer transport protein ExbD